MITNSHQRPKKAISGLRILVHIFNFQIVNYIWRPRHDFVQSGPVRTVTDTELGMGCCPIWQIVAKIFPKNLAHPKPRGNFM
jgi:hypothetical protein